MNGKEILFTPYFILNGDSLLHIEQDIIGKRLLQRESLASLVQQRLHPKESEEDLLGVKVLFTEQV